MSVDWPPQLERTETGDRTRNKSFEVTLNKAIKDLEREMGRLGVDDWRLETNMDHKKQSPNYPYADAAEPDDSAVVLRWTMGGEQFAVGCDKYTRVRDNVRSIGLYIREKRKMENRPVATAQSEFSSAALPPGDEERAMVVGRQPPWEVLGVQEDADPDVVKAAYRRLMRKYHPDSGEEPDEAEFKRINRAKEAMLDG